VSHASSAHVGKEEKPTFLRRHLNNFETRVRRSFSLQALAVFEKKKKKEQKKKKT
jgi:hypothetical protein